MQTELHDETLRFFDGDELRARVFQEKYALDETETTPVAMWKRIARTMASVEEHRYGWNTNFADLLEDFAFIPGGRIMFGADNPLKTTLLNCYFIPIQEDSLEGIFKWCKEAAITYSYGGGVGTDISILRPCGSPVDNSARTSSGAVSFMELFSTVTGTIGQHGRRGALMITMDVSHPDVEDFIEIKNDVQKSQVKYANISLKITDAFMNAVVEDTDFNLVYNGVIHKRISARKLWKKIVASAHKSAEPGIIFWDNCKNYTSCEYGSMKIKGTNPCAEQPLEDYGNCCLGSLNLSHFVANSFKKDAYIDYIRLFLYIRHAVRFLDNVITYNSNTVHVPDKTSRTRHPLVEQSLASVHSRRIGLGFTGLGDMLVKLGLKYDTETAMDVVNDMFDQIKNVAYHTSAQLAGQKGAFHGFDLEHHAQSKFYSELWQDTKTIIEQHGLRNACLLTVPPVGTGSVLAGVSSGIEPIFDIAYNRRSESLTQENYKVYHPLAKQYMDDNNILDSTELPDTFITAHDINPSMRVRMQSIIQKHIDSAISSTVNLPENCSPEEIEDIYMSAWKAGLKGITVYREGAREGILQTQQECETCQV